MLAMAASSRLFHWEAGSEVGMEVKLSLMIKRSKHNLWTATCEWPSAFSGEVDFKPVVCMLLQYYRFVFSQQKEGQLSACGL